MPRKKKTALEVRSTQIKITLAVMALLFVIVFWTPVWQVFLVFISILASLFGLNINPFTATTLKSMAVVAYNCACGFGGMLFILMIVVSWQSILPNEYLIDRYRSVWHIFLYILRVHGPAVFIKDGKDMASPENLRRLGPGVLVVDFNSATVLEEQVPPPGILRPIKNFLMAILIGLRLSNPRQSPRVCGPGITFTRRRERVRGVVDLRKQFRVLPGQRAYTRDGIEVTSNAIVMFTLGQDPDVLDVTFVGDVNSRNLRLVELRRLPPTPTILYERAQVVRLFDDLEDTDRDEIMRNTVLQRRQAPALSDREYDFINEYPQNYSANRVFSAVGSQARNPDNNINSWKDLTPRVAADIYRELVLQNNYDYYYEPVAPDRIQMGAIKGELRRRMRYNGILAYRFVQHKTGRPLRVNSIYPMAELASSGIYNFTNSKLLRDRGIKVLVSSFSDLVPPTPVYQQKLDAWRAPWMRDAEIVRAGYDLQTMRIRSLARRKSQTDLAASMERLYNTENISQEALAVRIFQSLELLASDPKTRELLPSETVNLMNSIHSWLLPGDEGLIINAGMLPPVPPPTSGGLRQ
jgi:hypothetical protein